jgi:hypothetical protein
MARSLFRLAEVERPRRYVLLFESLEVQALEGWAFPQQPTMPVIGFLYSGSLNRRRTGRRFVLR